jgi:hypothetical protein
VDAAGIGRSEIFPGLWLATAAMIEGNLSEVLSVLQKGMAGEEHAAFIKRLGSSGERR